MIVESLKELFRRDLQKLKQEIELYEKDSNLWKVESSIKNSGGNLCLHLIGNLNTFIGNGLAFSNTDLGKGNWDGFHLNPFAFSLDLSPWANQLS